MRGCKAEDAGGLAPVKDDSAAAAHLSHRTFPDHL